VARSCGRYNESSIFIIYKNFVTKPSYWKLLKKDFAKWRSFFVCIRSYIKQPIVVDLGTPTSRNGVSKYLEHKLAFSLSSVFSHNAVHSPQNFLIGVAEA
jgi:hypothetical protein